MSWLETGVAESFRKYSWMSKSESGSGPGQVGPVRPRPGRRVDRAVGEEVVLPDRPADPDAGPEALELGLNLALAAGLEARGRVVEARLAVEDVGARLRDAVDDEAARPAVLGRDAAALDVDLLDVELGEVLVEIAEERVRDVDAVVEERVVLAPSAGVDADVRVGDLDAAVDDARRELERPGEGPLQRQLLEGLRLVTCEISEDFVSTSGVAAVTVTSSATVARSTGQTSVTLATLTTASC